MVAFLGGLAGADLLDLLDFLGVLGVLGVLEGLDLLDLLGFGVFNLVCPLVDDSGVVFGALGVFFVEALLLARVVLRRGGVGLGSSKGRLPIRFSTSLLNRISFLSNAWAMVSRWA